MSEETNIILPITTGWVDRVLKLFPVVIVVGTFFAGVVLFWAKQKDNSSDVVSLK